MTAKLCKIHEVPDNQVSTVHILTQEGQPYGSERRCCNHCGTMLWPVAGGYGPLPPFVDNWTDWRASAYNCGRDYGTKLDIFLASLNSETSETERVELSAEMIDFMLADE